MWMSAKAMCGVRGAQPHSEVSEAALSVARRVRTSLCNFHELLAWWSFFRTSNLLKSISASDEFGQKVCALLAKDAADGTNSEILS
jgi:hypothetical protein